MAYLHCSDGECSSVGSILGTVSLCVLSAKVDAVYWKIFYWGKDARQSSDSVGIKK